MKITIPNRQTKMPSRTGLSYHEILADGLIHAALVFGLEPDEAFVERVASLAWENAVWLAHRAPEGAAKIARRLAESIEVGRTASERLCHEIGPLITAADNPAEGIRHYYVEGHSTRSLNLEDAADGDQVRQLVGEAILAGLWSRSCTPGMHEAILDHANTRTNEMAFLTVRLACWAVEPELLPRDHPFLEFCVHYYKDYPRRQELICTAIGKFLGPVLDQENPWALEHWLKPAWKEGILTTKFDPEQIVAVAKEFSTDHKETLRRIFRECVESTVVNGKVDMRTAFDCYASEINPLGFADVRKRARDRRLLAWCAYDFAFWMGVIAECPVTFHGKESPL